MKRQHAEEYTESLALIFGGAWRQLALAQKLGAHKALGLSFEEWRTDNLGPRIRLRTDERREAVAALKADGNSVRKIANALGYSKSQIARDLRGVPNGTESDTERSDSVPNGTLDALDVVAALASTTKVQANMAANATKRRLEAERAELLAQPVPVSDTILGLHRGDCRELAKSIPDSSVDLVLSDPPWSKETAAQFYGDLAEVAARVLKPGGSLITYCGQTALAIVLPAMEQHLRFWSQLVALNTAHTMIEFAGIRAGYRCLPWFVKGTRGDVQEVFNDVLPPVAREKSAHPWQQPVGEARFLIERLTSPGALILDPFAGSGTTGIAADELGRRWIGYEIDPVTYEIARERIADERAKRDNKHAKKEPSVRYGRGRDLKLTQGDFNVPS